MTIKAGKLKESMIPEPRRLYEVHNSRKIVVEEKQKIQILATEYFGLYIGIFGNSRFRSDYKGL